MTKEAAIYQFWSGFGLPAYEENSVPTGDEAPDFPYITYSVVTGEFDRPVSLSASLWYRSTSWTLNNAKTQEISTAIGRGGEMLRVDDGVLWIKRGSPFAQSMGDPSDDMIKRKYINIEAEYITYD